ncbi:MAG: transport permease protein [Ardenticatenaceae bacterium]|nr:MAG: transport permease protein [Ardenticatenaceae bacterium]
MNALQKMARVEFKLALREPVATFFTLVFPVLILFLFGSIYGNEPSDFLGGRGNVDNSVPGYIAMVIATTGMMSLPIGLATYRELGVLRRYRATPLRPQTLLGARIIVHTLISVIGSAVLVLAGVLVYDMALPTNIPALILAFLLGSTSFLAVGFLLASVLPNANTATAVGMAVLYPMLFLSGAGLPREILPDNLVTFGNFLPLTHVVELLKDVWYNNSWNLTSLAVVIGMMLVAGALSVRTFRWE